VAADVKKLMKRFESLKLIRLPYSQHWENIAEFTLPRKRGMMRKLAEGQKLTDSMYDMTPTEAAERLALFLHGALASTAYPFFGMEMRNRQLMDVKSIADWTEQCADLVLGAFTQSNWDAESPEALLDDVLFGTSSPLFLAEKPITTPGKRFGGLHFKALPLAETYLAENHLGLIDTCFWNHTLAAETVSKLFGKKCSVATQRLAESAPYEPIELLLAIYPRETPNRGPGAFSWEQPYAGCYVEIASQTLLEEKGYREFPAPTGRWGKANSDRIYGRGRGDTAYPDIRTLNEGVRYKMMSWALAVFPPFMKDIGFAGSVRWLPGAEHEVDGKAFGMNPPIQAIKNEARFDVAEAEEEQRREAIRRAFFWSLTELPEKGPQMTAREVQIRLRIMQRALGVDPGRIRSEILEPTIGRAFSLMLHAGALPPPPDELFQLAGEEGAAIDIVYKGPLAMSQRSDDTIAIESQVDYVLSIYERTEDPAVLDTVDLDEATWARAEYSSTPSKISRGKDQVAQIRADRAQAQAELAAREERNLMADEMLKKNQAMKAGNETAAAAGAQP
jgi:hypothetical protein